MSLRFLTAGESHGERLTVILDGIPAGLTLREEDLVGDLRRRQGGHGRGGRMAIEQDVAHIVAGVRGGLTLGSPITLEIANRDWENWRQVMAVDAAEVKRKPITRVRPGHADLAGRPRQRPAVGHAARRPPGPGDRQYPGLQTGRDRRRRGGSPTAGFGGA